MIYIYYLYLVILTILIYHIYIIIIIIIIPEKNMNHQGLQTMNLVHSAGNLSPPWRQRSPSSKLHPPGSTCPCAPAAEVAIIP
jgi:hypothetical protein